MAMVFLQFFVSALVIVLAGSMLAKFADKIADITGWGRLFVGGFLLAAGTSLPELMVDINAIRLDLPDLAVGDLLGSSLYNLLILAVLDFAYPSAFRRTAFSHQNIHHSLSATLGILLTALVGVGIATGLNLSWIIIGTYLFGMRLIFLENSSEGMAGRDSQKTSVFGQAPFRNAVLGYLISAGVIVISAPFLVDSADQLARASGLGHTFIGTALVALATSLPELVSTFVAFRMGSPDLAIGNIFGSNAFNMVLFVPLDFLYPKVLFNSVKSIHLVTAFSVVCVMSIALMGQLYRRKARSRFTEPSSEIIVIVIFLFLYLLYAVT